MRQLAERYPWIDLDRAGIWGHSGGGNATAGAMFRYPGFFKVGIAESGNHDNRSYEDDWAEKWQGPPVIAKDGSSNYDDPRSEGHTTELQSLMRLTNSVFCLQKRRWSVLKIHPKIVHELVRPRITI